MEAVEGNNNVDDSDEVDEVAQTMQVGASPQIVAPVLLASAGDDGNNTSSQQSAPLAEQEPGAPPVNADHGGVHGHVAGSAASQQEAVPTQHTLPPSQASQDIPVNLDDLPPYHVVHRQFIPTITHIPKAARSDWTRLYTSVCWKVANNPANLANHILYSMLARVILPAGKAPPHPGDTTQASKIKERIRRWRAGEFLIDTSTPTEQEIFSRK